jgi:hypothetical protein
MLILGLRNLEKTRSDRLLQVQTWQKCQGLRFDARFLPMIVWLPIYFAFFLLLIKIDSEYFCFKVKKIYYFLVFYFQKRPTTKIHKFFPINWSKRGCSTRKMLTFERQMKNLKIRFNFTVSIHGTFIICFHVYGSFSI